MRILIGKEKSTDIAYPLPWKSDGTCFNFRAPTRAISPTTKINTPEKVKTLVISCDLSEYSFIGEMVNLEQLYIYEGKNVTELSFLKELTKLQQLCIVGTNLEFLDGLVELIEKKSEIYQEFADKSPAEELRGRLTYGFEGIYLQSDKYEGDGKEILMPNILRKKDVCINGKYICE